MVFRTLILNSVIFLASALHGVFGFAFVLVAVPLLSLFQDIKTIVPLTSLLFIVISGYRSFQLRNEYDYKQTVPLIIGALFGIPIGIFIITVLSERIVKSILGIVIILYAVHSLVFKKVSHQPRKWSAYLFGFLSGALGGAFNMTGPPVVFYACSRDWTKTNIYGSLNFYFLITSIIVILFHALAGNITRHVLISFVSVLPALFVGMFLGNRIFIRVKEGTYRTGLYVFLIAAGVILLK